MKQQNIGLENAPPSTGEWPVSTGSNDVPLAEEKLRHRFRQIRLARRGSDVRRYHTTPLIGEQTDGHHTFNMLVMLTLLHPLPTLYLYRAVMFHDTPEERYGDTPSPALWASPALRKAYEDAHSEYLKTEFDLHALNREELDWLECLDKLEALYFSQHQMKLGNYHFQEIITNIFGWFEERSKMNRMPYRIQQIIEVLQDEIVNGR